MPLAQQIYRRRFADDRVFRDAMYKVLCQDLFQDFVRPSDKVLDLAAGFCEFINNIDASVKWAVDTNADVERHATAGVKTLVASALDLRAVANDYFDVVFTSNFLEHLSRDEIVASLHEVQRVLRPGGRFIILQPNYRYCYRDYWMFFDHITPLDDRSLSEILEVSGFEIEVRRPRLLPYTTKGWLPKSVLLLKLYLRFPLAQLLLGKQAFFVVRKR